MLRLARTVVLGTVAAALGIWWLGDAYEIETPRLLGFLLSSVLFVVGCIAFAAIAGVAMGWLMRLRGRRSRQPTARRV